jgi:hypothetical protein
MGSKFRRGTTAQKSGSLAFGEPYVNTDLNTLQVGGANGDILLAAAGTSSVFVGSSVSASSWVSASSLRVTGNAQIDGNLTLGGAITIGDNVSDTVNVVASLSSSLIPSTTNTFDLGSTTKVWKDLYISTGSIKFVEGSTVVSTLTENAFSAISGGYITFSAMLNDGRIATTDNSKTNKFTGSQFINGDINITGSIVPGVSNTYDLGSVDKFFRDLYISTGSIKMVSNGVVVSTLSNTGNGMLLDQGITAKGDSSFGTSSAAITSVTGSLNISGSVAVVGSLSASTINGIGNVTLYSSSVATRLAAAESFSSSLDSTFATDASVTIVSASAWGAFQSASSYSASAATDLSSSNAARVALSASVAASGFAVSSSVASATATSITTLSSSVKAVTDTFATSASVASATATSITSLSSSVKAVTDTFATSASVASATATSISTISGSVKTVTDALSGRVTTLEGKDISITLTGDVTGTGTITDLANVSFATTIAADSVALGTDTTGNYVATMTAGAGITVGTATGEGSTPVITNTGVTSITGTANQVVASASTGGVTLSLPQSIATNSAVSFASVSATGDIVAYSGSDKRLKNNIVNISDAVTKVRKLNGVTWKWNDDVNEVTKTAPTTGLIAQEVQEVLPEVVNEREDGYLGIDYSKMIGLLVEAIKEQQNQIDSLTIEIENLKKNNSL